MMQLWMSNNMGKRIFDFSFNVYGKIEVDDDVINVVDDAWRKELYDLETPEEIIEMIARCMLQGADLSSLDGWANQPDKNARIIDNNWELDEINELNPED